MLTNFKGKFYFIFFPLANAIWRQVIFLDAHFLHTSRVPDSCRDTGVYFHSPHPAQVPSPCWHPNPNAHISLISRVCGIAGSSHTAFCNPWILASFSLLASQHLPYILASSAVHLKRFFTYVIQYSCVCGGRFFMEYSLCCLLIHSIWTQIFHTVST